LSFEFSKIQDIKYLNLLEPCSGSEARLALNLTCLVVVWLRRLVLWLILVVPPHKGFLPAEPLLVGQIEMLVSLCFSVWEGDETNPIIIIIFFSGDPALT
jgi:hypothetical protein